MLGDLNCTMDKIYRDSDNKEFIGAAPIMPCQNASWIMGLRIMEKRESRFPLVHLLQ